jgi:hypothetical protein
MNKYEFRIVAKNRGAIGAFSNFSPVVEAETLKKAELKLYDRFDHIRVVSVKENGQPIQYVY